MEVNKFIKAISSSNLLSLSPIRRRCHTTYHGIAGVHHQNSIAVHHGVETMRDGQHGALGEFRAYGFLNELVGLRVDVRGSFVENEDPIVFDDGACQTDELTLADAQIGTTLVDVGLQPHLLQLHFLQRLPQQMVAVVVEGI